MRARPVLVRGDVVLVPFPFTDLSSLKLRPALTLAHSGSHDVLVAFITSRVGTRVPPTDCLLDPAHPEFPGSGLKVRSAVRLDRIATLDRRVVLRRLGRIGPLTQVDVDRGLRRVFHL